LRIEERSSRSANGGVIFVNRRAAFASGVAAFGTLGHFRRALEGGALHMKSLLRSATFLLLDMASTFFYIAVFLLTKSIAVAAVAGIGLGIGQVLWERYRGKPIEAMQWMSLFLVVASAVATVLTHDPRFVMLKASVIYVIIGVVMLKPGWMNRYLPQQAIDLVPDIAFIFGFVWAGLMFLSAAVNIVAALKLSVLGWTGFMSAYALSTKIALFLIQYATMRFIAVRRHRAAEATDDALPAQA
jgi:intracellular septation protein